MFSYKTSLCYNGENHKISLEGEKKFDGVEMFFEYKSFGENAFYALPKIKNTKGSNSGIITMPLSLDMAFKTQGKPLFLHTLTGDDCGANSFLPIDCEIKNSYKMQPSGGRSSNQTAFPYFETSCNGKAYLFAIGWSGQWQAEIVKNNDEYSVKIGLFDAAFYLKANEEVRLPSVIVIKGENAQALRREFKELMRSSFSPAKRLGDKMALPIAIQCFDRYFQGLGGKKDDKWATEIGQMKTVTSAKKCGKVDTLWLDAAWFKEGFPFGVGNYSFAPGFSNGLAGVSRFAHKDDMQFLLWFEPERVCRGSEVFENHHDFLLKRQGKEDERLFDLGNPKALDWLVNTIINFIEENEVDLYRNDCNIDPLLYWQENDEENRKGIKEMKYIAGLYEFWDSLIAKFPQMLIDNCASGGRRLDFELLSRSVCLWRSDTGCFPENEEKRVSAWSLNQILTLSEYLPYHACATWLPDTYSVRSCATQGIACTFDIFNESFDFNQASAVLDEVVQLQDFWNGAFFPLTKPTNEENVITAYQLSSKGSGVAYVFRREFCENDSITLRLHEIIESSSYEVTMINDNFEKTTVLCSGADLLNGFEVTLPQKRSSMVIRYSPC